MDLVIKRHLLSKSKVATITRGEEGTQFTCVECSAKFDDKEKLEIHLYTHYRMYRFVCEICGTGLKRKEHLDRHMQEHMEFRPYVCPECGKAFKRKEHLNIHSSIHKGDKNLACTLCNKSFYRKDHLQKHLQTHNKHFFEVNINPLSEQELDIKQEPMEYDELQPIITSVTGNADGDNNSEADESGNQSTGSLANNVQYDSSRPYVCNICGKSYKRKDHLKIHSWTHKEKEVLCGQCGKAFHTEDQMMVHVNLVHLRAYETNNDGINQLKALLGDQIDVEILNDDSSELLVPRKKQQIPENRPHECPVCHRRFKRKQHLKIHANIHLKVPQTLTTVWCSICNEGFTNKTVFENHSCQWGQEQAEGGEYESSETNHELNSPHDTKKENNPIEFVEVVVNEGEDRLPSPRRVFVCKYCNKPFKRKDHYRIHLHVHTGVKDFFCPECRKGFYRKDHLQKHMIVHAKIRTRPQQKRDVPGLVPIDMMPKKEIKPEITIHAPSTSKIRVPLQIKVPYQMVTSLENGERHAVTVDPTDPSYQGDANDGDDY